MCGVSKKERTLNQMRTVKDRSTTALQERERFASVVSETNWEPQKNEDGKDETDKSEG